MNDYKKIAIVESFRPNEQRIPIHPSHFQYLLPLKDRLFFQENYGKDFRQNDSRLRNFGFGLESRDRLLETSDLIFLLKPTIDDLKKIKKNTAIIGWHHAIQQKEIAQVAVERGLTLIAMEAMYEPPINNYARHLFYDNNFIAGLMSVQHALSLSPIKHPLSSRIAVISYGNVSQGAVVKLIQFHFQNITVYSRRDKEIITNRRPNIAHRQIFDKNGILTTKDQISLNKVLPEFDIIINGIMQDPLRPYQFLNLDDLKGKKDKLLIDISCDKNMGFSFSSPTSWENPIEKIDECYYYSIENTPTLLHGEASLLISEKLFPLINSFLINHISESQRRILKEATEIEKGVILNERITQYQSK